MPIRSWLSSSLTFAVLMFAVATAHATPIHYADSVSGDAPGIGFGAETPGAHVGTLGIGVNRITGRVKAPGAEGDIDRTDDFNFTIAEGTQLDSIRYESLHADLLVFFHVAFGEMIGAIGVLKADPPENPLDVFLFEADLPLGPGDYKLDSAIADVGKYDWYLTVSETAAVTSSGGGGLPVPQPAGWPLLLAGLGALTARALPRLRR